MNYILNGKTPVQVESITEWAEWFEKGDRIVKQTDIGEVKISTVFLGIDHNFHPNSKAPILFETMVFGGVAISRNRALLHMGASRVNASENVRQGKGRGDSTPRF